MKYNKKGKQSIIFHNRPSIVSVSSIVGPKEAEGPFKDYFKNKLKDDTLGQATYEKSEREMLKFAIKDAVNKTGMGYDKIDLILGGDLLNQIVSSTFSAREFNAPFLGLYSACSTYTEAMLLGAVMTDGKYKENAVCCTASHFSSVERQYRFPLELGTAKTPAGQWTVTGGAACVLALKPGYPYMEYGTMGRVVDYGINDANNMGAAMAPAAMDTIIAHFLDTQTSTENYDLIITGDLGILGSSILEDLMKEKGYDIKDKHKDCGAEIFEHKPLVHQGGSGPACSAVLFNSYFYDKLLSGELKNVLFLATGALLSPTTTQQGDTIPAIAHALSVRSPAAG